MAPGVGSLNLIQTRNKAGDVTFPFWSQPAWRDDQRLSAEALAGAACEHGLGRPDDAGVVRNSTCAAPRVPLARPGVSCRPSRYVTPAGLLGKTSFDQATPLTAGFVGGKARVPGSDNLAEGIDVQAAVSKSARWYEGNDPGNRWPGVPVASEVWWYGPRGFCPPVETIVGKARNCIGGGGDDGAGLSATGTGAAIPAGWRYGNSCAADCLLCEIEAEKAAGPCAAAVVKATPWWSATAGATTLTRLWWSLAWSGIGM
jgi:hypothetical protein